MINKINELYLGLISNNMRSLSKAITLVENTTNNGINKAAKLIDLIMPYTGNSMRIGVSGAPGVGKSTLIEKLGLIFISKGKKVAVLAIDPSSPKTYGSILGDKTRMNQLSINTNAYIRPSPSRGLLGGVTYGTYESILILEAAKFDIIFIETVGVGQSEIEISNLCDNFLLILQKENYDELQSLKRGILEVADIILINKSDLKLKNNYDIRNMQALNRANNEKNILHISALKNNGLRNIVEKLNEINKNNKKNGKFENKRKKQIKKILYSKIKNELLNNFFKQNNFDHSLKNILNKKKSIKATVLEITNNFNF